MLFLLFIKISENITITSKGSASKIKFVVSCLLEKGFNKIKLYYFE